MRTRAMWKVLPDGNPRAARKSRERDLNIQRDVKAGRTARIRVSSLRRRASSCPPAPRLRPRFSGARSGVRLGHDEADRAVLQPVRAVLPFLSSRADLYVDAAVGNMFFRDIQAVIHTDADTAVALCDRNIVCGEI